MLPISYRVVKGFATFFGVMGILACIAGLIAGIIVNGGDSKPKNLQQSSLSGASSGERGVAGPAGSTAPEAAKGSGGAQAASSPVIQPATLSLKS